VITSPDPLPRGAVTLAFEFDRKEKGNSKESWEPTSGTGRLYINGKLSAQTPLPAVWPPDDSFAMFIGRSAGPLVSEAFVQPFAFTGTLKAVHLNLKHPVSADH
jgi:hypothetical protein